MATNCDHISFFLLLSVKNSLFHNKMPLNFIPEFPVMAADRSTIDRHLIWSVRSFYARPEACNSQRVISETGGPLSVPASLFWANYTPASRWLTHHAANEIWNPAIYSLYQFLKHSSWKWCRFMSFFHIFVLCIGCFSTSALVFDEFMCTKSV